MVQMVIRLFLLLVVPLLAVDKPNFIHIVIDDLGTTDLGFMGSEYKTPFLDRFFKEECLELVNYYVHSTCTPTRSTFMTGRYSHNLGLQDVRTKVPGSTMALPLDVPTLPEMLKKEGYATHMIGKWHLGNAKTENIPTSRGFDTFHGYLMGAGFYETHELCVQLPNATEPMCKYDFWNQATPDWSANGTYSNDIYVNDTLDLFDKKEADTPFYLYLSFQTVHAPISVPPNADSFTECDDIEYGPRKIYCQKLNYLDNALDRIFRKMKATGLWDTSYVVISTDNGGMPCEAYPGTFTNGCGKNLPLRGGKATVFEGGLKGVGFITGGLLPKDLVGKQNKALLHSVDIAPGIMKLAGVDISKMTFDGIPLFDVHDEKAEGHESLILQAVLNPPGVPFPAGAQRAVRKGNWKYIEGYPLYDGYWESKGKKPNLPERWDNCTAGCLFNLENDPNELVNVMGAHPVLKKELLTLLEEAMKNAAPVQNNTFHREAA